MAIHVSCDQCFGEFKVKDEARGKRIKCRECGTHILVRKRPKEQYEDKYDYDYDYDEAPAPSRRSWRQWLCRARRRNRGHELSRYGRGDQVVGCLRE